MKDAAGAAAGSTAPTGPAAEAAPARRGAPRAHNRHAALLGAAFDAAAARAGTPWQRLERGAAAHLAMLLGTRREDADFAGVFVQVQPHDFPPEHFDALIALRNGYEDRFRRLLAALPLVRGTDRRLLRLQLIGALNHVPLWYRPDGRRTPATIAHTMTRQLQRGVGTAPETP